MDEEDNQPFDGEATESEEKHYSVKRKGSDLVQDKVKKARVRNLLRQPTNEELTQLRETENLFNSNLFRMQIDEILKEVKLKPKTIRRFSKWFADLNEHLSRLPVDNIEYNLDEKKSLKNLGVKLPLHFDSRESHATISFRKCDLATLTGAFDLDCALNANIIVDIQIKMPSSMFTKNDSINYRYHKKKAAYLTFLCSHLSKSELVEELNYSFLNKSELQPVLLIKPKGKLSENLQVRLQLSGDESIIKFSRLDLSRNNVREHWYFSEESESQAYLGPPTPYYNQSILQDITQDINKDNIKKVLCECENLKSAIVLLKIWLRQRIKSLTVSGHIISMFVVHLVQSRRINNIMSSYQIVRNVWISLSNSTWDSKGISLYDKGKQNDTTLEDFHKAFPVVFLDYTGYYNLCWNMSINTYNALKMESAFAVNMLDNANINSFIPLFMTPFKFELQFDDIFILKDSESIIQQIYEGTTREEKLNFGPDYKNLAIIKVLDVLKEGLTQRVQLILHKPLSDMIWPTTKSLKRRSISDLCFGLILDPVNCLSSVDKGPQANLPGAELFRKFWGNKSELRRFQDGSIMEACVWEAESMSEKRVIVKQIVKYLFEHKFGIKEDIFYVADQLDSVLVPRQYLMKDVPLGTGEEAAMKVLEAFHSLRNELRNINDLPLFINSVYGTSSVFSYSDPLPPLAEGSPQYHYYSHKDKCATFKAWKDLATFRCPRYVATSHAIIELGHSGKWPGDLEAFRRLKAAFCVQIAESLTKQYSLPTHVFPDHFVVMKDGYIFKLEIVHPKEVLLTARYTENGVVKFKDTEQTLELKCRGSYLPKLRGSLHGLHQKHPAYGPTVALTKRFFRAHMLDHHHIPDLVVELLVAKTFLMPQPYSAPIQPLQGFHRVLNMMTTTVWASELVVLNFNDDFARESLAELESRFNTDRSQFPPLCIVTSSEGEDYSVWSRKAPDVRTLAFTTNLCKVALEKFKRELFELNTDNVLTIFKPTLAHYDAVIHLNTEFIPNHGAKLDVKPRVKVLQPPTKHDKTLPILEFDPVACYLKELREAYDDFALFFHDTYGGDVIGVLWRPSVFEPRDFQVLNSKAIKPKKDKFVVNLQAIIEDFKILGHLLVTDISLNTKIK